MAGPQPDVLVVGAGPAGVVAALLLGDLGVRTLLIDKRTEVSSLPRARGVHARATEILRQLGVEADMVASALPIDPRMEVRPTVGAEPVAVVSTGGSSWTEVSPCDGIAIAQDDFETVLRRHLARRPSVEVRLGRELTDLDVGRNGRVSATLRDLSSGQATTVTPTFVVGADGWRSSTRRLIDVPLLGDGDLGTTRSVRFRADLSPWLGSPPPAFVRLLVAKAVLLPTHRDGRWVVMQPAADPSVETADAFVRRVLGVDVALDVIGEGTWTAAVQQAREFRRGPVFLIGDAAHRVTPAGATGISSAMADAHNLSWKIAAVLAGWGGPALMDTYAAERGAVARMVCAANRRMWDDTIADRPPAGDLRQLDMGYVYASDAIVGATPSGTEPAFPPGDGNGTGSTYVQSASPGARAPHVWISSASGRISTLDLYGRGFVVVTDDPGSPWIDPVAVLARDCAVPVTAVALSEPAAAAGYGLSPGEAVLVRPDGHVAWRSGASPQAGSSDDAIRRLTRALDAATCVPRHH
jgi:putative polyketide hydroxylase